MCITFSEFIVNNKRFCVPDECAGQLIYVVNNTQELPKLRTHLQIMMRSMWVCSPNHASRIVTTILNNPALRLEW